MTCIKTGARVYLPDYGLAAPADFYAVAQDTVLVVFNGDPTKHNFSYVGEPPSNTTHIVTVNPPRVAEVRFDRQWILVQTNMIEELP